MQRRERSAPLRASRRRPRYWRASSEGRSGFTLFEVTLVLVLSLAAIAIAWPSLSRLRAHHHLQQSAELVRARMLGGRLHALETGMTYQFRYTPGGRSYVVLPFDQDPTQVGEALRTVVEKHAGLLPETITFQPLSPDAVSAQTGISPGAIPSDMAPQSIDDALLTGLPEVEKFTGLSWSPPILFLADGTATPAAFLLQSDREAVQVTVRGLTGGVTAATVVDGPSIGTRPSPAQ
jgi:hypothetical protein